jgi:large subunit ribosomal protein L31
MKENTHPKWYPEAEVICEGEVVMRVGSTKPQITVDVWSGTHPFFTGEQRLLDTEGQVDRFLRRLQVRQEMDAARQETRKRQDPRKLEVGAMGLDTRAYNALVDGGYTTVGDVLDAVKEDEDILLAVQGVGQKAMIDIRRYLRTEELLD